MGVDSSVGHGCGFTDVITSTIGQASRVSWCCSSPCVQIQAVAHTKCVELASGGLSDPGPTELGEYTSQRPRVCSTFYIRSPLTTLW